MNPMTKARRAGLLIALLPCCALPAVAAQTCDTSRYPLSTPADRFTDNGDGTLTDRQSGLTWMRCALGQTWSAGHCSGEPDAFSWSSAQGAARELNGRGGYAGHADWRMPHIPELAMIVERQCANPRVNVALFPDTPATYFWTATARRGKGQEGEAYLLSFGPEGAAPRNKDDRHYARLVRSDPR